MARSRPAPVPLLVFALLLSACDRTPERRRVVLITIDTLRYDVFSGARPGMPLTSELAERGQRFTRFYAASSETQPTHASLFTGLHPWQHGVPENGAVLPEHHVTLAERLQQAGYATAAVVASFPLERRFGFAQGFDVYDDEFISDIGVESWVGEEVTDQRFYTTGEEITRRALALLDELEAPRQFLWLHYFDPHEPYGDTVGEHVRLFRIRELAASQPRSARARLRDAARLYRRDVANLDRALAPLLERLMRDSEEFDTHVVFTADHGESFGENGITGHGDHLSPEQIHVPTFILSPGLPPGERTDTAGSIDLAATLLALADVDGSLGDSRDLLATREGTALGMRARLDQPYPFRMIDGRIAMLPEFRFFVVRDEHVYVGDGQGLSRADEGEEGAEVRALFGRLADELVASEPVRDRQPETLEALRALGYAK